MTTTEPQSTDYANDIPMSVAIAAHAGTSFVPETRGANELREYRSTLETDYAALRRQAEKGGTINILDEQFATYRARYAAATRAYLHSRSRCLSWMITGPARFPSARNQQRNEIAHRRLADLIELRKRALHAIFRALRPDLRPIMSGDDDAVTRLRTKLADAKTRQDHMKKVNAAIRKNLKAGHEARVAAIVEFGYSDATAREILKPDFAGRVGFADYETKNNGANIRTMEKRLALLEKHKGQSMQVEERNGVRIEDDPPANRIRIFFPGKPDSDMRDRLKSNGFRWAPSGGCWQAYRRHHTVRFAKSFLVETNQAVV